MPRFQFKAKDAAGKLLVDEIQAPSQAEARQLLGSRGLRVEELTLVVASSASMLSTEESEQVTSRVAQLSNASLPLAAGLRAAADECGNRRVTNAMYEIADRVERGQSLEDILTDSNNLFPPHVSGLVLAATKTGKLGTALSELLDHQRAARSRRSSIIRGFAYPLFVLCLATIVMCVTLFGISGTFVRMFNEFGLELPFGTRLLIWWRDYGVVLVSCFFVGCAATVGLLRVVLSRARWAYVASSIPIFGPLAYWTGLAEWCSLLSVLMKHQIALPEALRLSAAGIENAYVAKIAEDLSQRTSQGHILSDLLSIDRPLPATFVPLVRWGERVGLLDEAFDTARELFDRRARVRAAMLQAVLPPLLFVFIACGVVMVVFALFMPLISLITGLS